MPFAPVEPLLTAPDASIRGVIACIDAGGRGIALVVDAECRLLGTITDGDIRRAMLAALDLGLPVTELLRHKAAEYRQPYTAPVGSPREHLLKLMHEHVIHQVPLLDAAGRVVGLATLDELLPDLDLPLQAVVMAGGFGSRLAPLTDHTPKPMLPVGGKPVMEHIIGQLSQAGIRQVNVTTHYLPEAIQEHFGDGGDFGVSIQYVNEDRPLGTAGALGLMDKPTQPLLVINGDILTQLDVRAMLAFHREHAADMTVGVRHYEFQVPYGVVESDGVDVKALTEKPEFGFFVNAGVYLIEPAVHARIPPGEFFNMTDLIQRLLTAGRPVVSFPIREYWLDIGQHEDYQRAERDFMEGKLKP
jgi:dTDP-glucose pyrophosphorylase/CBS domain-containing protein